MQVFCPLDSAARAEGFDYGLPSINLTGYEMPPTEPGSIGTLIRNFKDYLDVCNSPQYRHFHATTSWVYGHHPQPLAPLMTAGVQTTFADIHCLIIEQFDLEVGVDPLWEDRPFASLQWRGQTSGPLWESGTPWRTTQRARLHLLTHSEKGDAKVVSTDYRGMARNGSLPNYRVGPTYFDAGMVGPAVQCIQEDGTCDKMFEVFQGYDKRMTFVKASLFKYVLGEPLRFPFVLLVPTSLPSVYLDIDGNRFVQRDLLLIFCADIPVALALSVGPDGSVASWPRMPLS